eukprot:2477082-Pyramimonas_sp.AAC.1
MREPSSRYQRGYLRVHMPMCFPQPQPCATDDTTRWKRWNCVEVMGDIAVSLQPRSIVRGAPRQTFLR